MTTQPRRTGRAAIVALLLTAATIAGPSAAAEAKPDGARVPVIVELFTSEGCSSCPPADDVLSKLVAEQPVPNVQIIGLSEHVDYWNHLGWRDPYSDARFTARQKDYAATFALTSLYTPQVVVDGRGEFVGTDVARIVAAATRAARQPRTTIGVEREGRSADGESLRVEVAGIAARSRDDSADIVLAVTEDHLTSTVSRGENQGRRLTHAAVVRRLTTIGRLTGASRFASRSFVAIDAGWKREALHAVVFVQDNDSRAILGACAIPLFTQAGKKPLQ